MLASEKAAEQAQSQAKGMEPQTSMASDSSEWASPVSQNRSGLATHLVTAACMPLAVAVVVVVVVVVVDHQWWSGLAGWAAVGRGPGGGEWRGRKHGVVPRVGVLGREANVD